MPVLCSDPKDLWYYSLTIYTQGEDASNMFCLDGMQRPGEFGRKSTSRGDYTHTKPNLLKVKSTTKIFLSTIHVKPVFLLFYVRAKVICNFVVLKSLRPNFTRGGVL